MTYDTVAVETPANLATSRIVGRPERKWTPRIFSAIRIEIMRGKSESSRAAAVLPVELQRKLSFTSVADGIVYRSKWVTRGVIQEIRVPNSCPKVGMIQEIEELGPELQIGPFGCLEFLEN